MTEFQRDSEVIQTLHDIPFKPAGVRHQLCYHFYFCTFQCHTPGHDKSDIPGAKDDNFSSRKIPFYIYKSLCRPRRINSRRTIPRNIQCSPGTFPAAHCQNHRFCLNQKHAFLTVHRCDNFFPADVYDHGIQFVFYILFSDLTNKTVGIFRSGQFFSKGMKPKTIMNALVQNSSQFFVPLQNQSTFDSVFSR